MGIANVFGWIMAAEEIPQTIAKAMLSLTSDRNMIIILINVLLLIVGMFMETIAALIILFPTSLRWQRRSASIRFISPRSPC